MRKLAYIAALLVLGGLSLFVGVSAISPADLWRMDPAAWQLMFASRLPRLISIITSGMGMAVAGVIMQMIASNRFVAPSTGSTVEWARLGVLAAILLFPGASPFVKMAVAFVFAFGGTWLFMRFLQLVRLRDTALVPLIGILFGGVVGSLTTFIAYRHDLVQNISAWMQGSFSMILRGRYELLYLGLPFVALAVLYADRFTIVSMGESMSSNLGVRYQATVQLGLVIVAMITSTVVVTIGSLPFVGIIIPNIVRMYRGDNLRGSIVDLALIGGLFVLVCDILSRLIIFPFEIPISVTAGVIGCAIFLVMLGGGRRHEKA